MLRFALNILLLCGTANALPFGLDGLPFLKSAFVAAKEVGAEHDLYHFLFQSIRNSSEPLDNKLVMLLYDGMFKSVGEDALNGINAEQYEILESKLTSSLYADDVDLSLADGPLILNWMMGKNLEHMSGEIPALIYFRDYKPTIQNLAAIQREKLETVLDVTFESEAEKLAKNQLEMTELETATQNLINKTYGISNELLASALPFESKMLLRKAYKGIADWCDSLVLAEILPTLKVTNYRIGVTNKDLEMIIGILHDPDLTTNVQKLKLKLEDAQFDFAQMKALNQTLDELIAQNKTKTLLFDKYLDSWSLTMAVYRSTVVNELWQAADIKSNLQTVTGSLLEMQNSLIAWAKSQRLSIETQNRIVQIFKSLSEQFNLH